MHRRSFLAASSASLLAISFARASQQQRWEEAAGVLQKAVDQREVAAAVLQVQQRDSVFTRHFGEAKTADAMFLLGSISKPICMTALLKLYDENAFQLDDPVKKYLPQFAGEDREKVTIRHLLTHTSGLPDQLAENDKLRKNHAPLSEFVAHALRTPLAFAPGRKYLYSSMGILLAAHIAEIISRTEIRELVQQTVFKPLKMHHSAQGLGMFPRTDFVRMQTEHAAPEAGGGDPAAKEWDWNSLYWRKLGAPWGGTHASAGDLCRFLAEFMHAEGKVVQPATAKLMTRNHNGPQITPRGLGFHLGFVGESAEQKEKIFGHTGSTGTIAWADPTTETIAVILTSLPARAVQPHPRDVAAVKIIAAKS